MTDVSQEAKTFQRASVTAKLAQKIITAAKTKAVELGVPVAVAIVDESGVLKAFSRQDDAALFNVQVSQDKAYTAVGFGMPTENWHPMIKDDAPLAAGAVGGIDRLVIIGGGYPIEIEGQIVGAIGVSGGHYTQDQEIAQAGLKAID